VEDERGVGSPRDQAEGLDERAGRQDDRPGQSVLRWLDPALPIERAADRCLTVSRVEVGPLERRKLARTDARVCREQDDRRHLIAIVPMDFASQLTELVDFNLGQGGDVLAPLRRLEPQVRERILVAEAVTQRVGPHRASYACRVPAPPVRPPLRGRPIDVAEPSGAKVGHDLLDRIFVRAASRRAVRAYSLSQILAHCSTVIVADALGVTLASASTRFASASLLYVPSHRCRLPAASQTRTP
jgi:hypothetical protein